MAREVSQAWHRFGGATSEQAASFLQHVLSDTDAASRRGSSKLPLPRRFLRIDHPLTAGFASAPDIARGLIRRHILDTMFTTLAAHEGDNDVEGTVELLFVVAPYLEEEGVEPSEWASSFTVGAGVRALKARANQQRAAEAIVHVLHLAFASDGEPRSSDSPHSAACIRPKRGLPPTPPPVDAVASSANIELIRSLNVVNALSEALGAAVESKLAVMNTLALLVLAGEEGKSGPMCRRVSSRALPHQARTIVPQTRRAESWREVKFSHR